MVERKPSKLHTWVRFPSPAPISYWSNRLNAIMSFLRFQIAVMSYRIVAGFASSDQALLLLAYRLAFGFGKGSRQRRRVKPLGFVHQSFNGKNLNFGICSFLVQKIHRVASGVGGFFAHWARRFFQSDKDASGKFLII